MENEELGKELEAQQQIRERFYDVSVRMLALEGEYQEVLEMLHGEKKDCLHGKVMLFQDFWRNVIMDLKSMIHIGENDIVQFCNTLAAWIALSKDRSHRIQRQLVEFENLQLGKKPEGE